MAKKQLKRTVSSVSMKEAIPRFVISQTAKGVSEKTIANYYNHFDCLAKHLDYSIPFNQLTNSELDAMIVSLRKSGLAHNSISSYLRVFRTFLKWARQEGLTTLELPNFKDKETIKETYSDEELKALLTKPKADSDFCEYRNWVIINFLLNCGCRASTIRNIQNRDIDLQTKQVRFRHTKNGKIQIIPLCNLMTNILRDYIAVRGGEPTDYLFCNLYGEMLTENALRLAIAKYNRKRGVYKTSVHLFRHTFARKYLIDCGGDAFTLQRLLGHSTLNMTKHYCAIFDADISKNYDNFSPLAQIAKPKERITR